MYLSINPGCRLYKSLMECMMPIALFKEFSSQDVISIVKII